jgi:hypothetical protein
LELEVVHGDGEHVADLIFLAEVGYSQFRFLGALLGFEVKDIKATKMQWAMANGCCCCPVDSHLGEKGG